ncbi:cell adhesion molecule 4-like [Ptychodera flava]|uniref:cell adhesion molecule 4-like n=1 Tax=Ptychodera flava TaxID=63121 RepID=UPI00396AAF09
MPSLYEWYRNDEVVSDESTHFIENVNRLDSGEYNCTATNEFYDNTNSSGHDVAYLDVQYPPSVKDGQIVCKEGDAITLTCEVDANPAPSSYTWTKDERELSSESSYNIPAVDRSDSGDYICTATNVYMTAQKRVIVVRLKLTSSVSMILYLVMIWTGSNT